MMFCYWYKDCRKDAQGFDRNKFIQAESIDEIIKYSTKEEFKCFEFEHTPTRIRMIEIGKTEISTGEWN